jgi:hypothetical protein
LASRQGGERSLSLQTTMPNIPGGPDGGRLRSLAHYWFVQYNPLYFFSALCILTGILLVSRDLVELGWERERLLLAAVLQAYEILLILGGALLFRTPGQRRPAVILGLLESVFLFDCTLQVEVLSALGRHHLLAAWVALVALKVGALLWAFRLKPSLGALALLVLGALGLAGTPALLSAGHVDPQTVHLAATWYFATLVALLLCQRPSVRCTVRLDRWGKTVLRRSLMAAGTLWLGLYGAHLVAWSVLFDVELGLPHAAPFVLLLPFLARHETWAWIGALGALASSAASPPTVSTTALMVALALGWLGRDTRRGRLWVGAVLAVYLAAWTAGWQGGPLPEPPLWLAVGTAAVLVVMAWRLRLLMAALLAPVVTLLGVGRYLRELGPQGWGILLLVAGFYSLIVGIGLNWREGARASSPSASLPMRNSQFR